MVAMLEKGNFLTSIWVVLRRPTVCERAKSLAGEGTELLDMPLETHPGPHEFYISIDLMGLSMYFSDPGNLSTTILPKTLPTSSM